MNLWEQMTGDSYSVCVCFRNFTRAGEGKKKRGSERLRRAENILTVRDTMTVELPKLTFILNSRLSCFFFVLVVMQNTGRVILLKDPGRAKFTVSVRTCQ